MPSGDGDLPSSLAVEVVWPAEFRSDAVVDEDHSSGLKDRTDRTDRSFFASNIMVSERDSRTWRVKSNLETDIEVVRGRFLSS
jgi:hypothetical protein